MRRLVGRRAVRGTGAALLSAGMALTCGACGYSPTPVSAAATAMFVASVHNNAPDISAYRSDVALIRLGHAACDGFRGGVGYQVLADRLTLNEGSHPVPTEDLGAVITAAVTSFCPQYESLVR